MEGFLRPPEMNPRRPPRAYLVCEGSEPLTFTNVFPSWERNLGAQTQVIHRRPIRTRIHLSIIISA